MIRPPCRQIVSAVAAASVALPAFIAADQGSLPGLDAVLAATAAYMDQYERDVSAVVAEEEYLQQAEFRRQRRLRSDFLVIRHDDFGWIEFRDVFQVDGIPVRDREQRLTNLFMKPREDAVQQARRIAEEGARFNLGSITRTINTPLVALRFLATRDRHRSMFRIDASRSRNSQGSVVLQFNEHAMPRMLMTPDDAAARGAFWIDPASGRVTATELLLKSNGSSVDIRVTFQEDRRLKIWLPVAMDERYGTGRGDITGRARYSNFRQFRVETTTDIGKH